MLALTGKAVEGDILTAIEVIPETETQKQVWSKYKKDIKYQWYGTTTHFFMVIAGFFRRNKNYPSTATSFQLVWGYPN